MQRKLDHMFVVRIVIIHVYPCSWIGHCERRGGPTKLNEVLDTVQAIVQEDKRVTPIKDGRPGRAWFKVRS